MNKSIVIVGGGISGLSLLYFLKKKYARRPDVRISLFERSSLPGGNIQTQSGEGTLFECGPNGFLDNQPAMLQMIDQLGLSHEMVSANQVAKKRFVVAQHGLHPLPGSLVGLFVFKPFSLFDKLRVLGELFIPKGNDPNETVYGFFKRRFGLKAAQYFADPMVNGVYAGNSEHLNLQESFPKIYDYEEKYGSVIKGIMASKISKTTLKSFPGGMRRLISKLAEAGGESVRLGEPVTEVVAAGRYFLVSTEKDKYPADELFMAVPAFVAGRLLGTVHDDLKKALMSVEYAPIAVVGLLFERSAFKKIPEGFGYLVPSIENNPVLGVLAESHIFEGRAMSSRILLRVMIGGVRNPEYIQVPHDRLASFAIEELNQRYGVTQAPLSKFVAIYPHAIPQYETSYPVLKRRIVHGLGSLKGLHLVSNYLDGVSMNDCVKNALSASVRSRL